MEQSYREFQPGPRLSALTQPNQSNGKRFMREEDRTENLKVKRKIPVRMLQSEWIFDGEKEVLIMHGEQQYRLQVTRAGKLILTK